MITFTDRRDAGKQLAEQLASLRDMDLIVLALPRGGVPVAFEVAVRLNLPLDVFLVRKLGYPGYPEFAMGAIATGGNKIINRALTEKIPSEVLTSIIRQAEQEIKRGELLYRGEQPAISVYRKKVILVDDGLATGSSMLAAVFTLRKKNPSGIMVAVPVSSAEATNTLRPHVEEIVCLHTPANLRAVGFWYHDFSQTSDQEVKRLLAEARKRLAA